MLIKENKMQIYYWQTAKIHVRSAYDKIQSRIPAQ